MEKKGNENLIDTCSEFPFIQPNAVSWNPITNKILIVDNYCTGLITFDPITKNLSIISIPNFGNDPLVLEDGSFLSNSNKNVLNFINLKGKFFNFYFNL